MWDGAGAIHAVRLRLTKLGAAGAPLVGAGNLLVSNALVRFGFTPQYSEGQELEQRNGADELCLYYKAPRTLKAMTGSLQICSPDPQLEEFLAGGVVLMDATDVVGYAAPEVGVNATPNGVSVEVWSRFIIDGDQAATDPWMHWLFPRMRFTPDEKALENAAQLPTFAGEGRTNAGWGTGPLADWTHTSDRLWQWVREDTLPAVTDGPVAVVAPAP